MNLNLFSAGISQFPNARYADNRNFTSNNTSLNKNVAFKGSADREEYLKGYSYKVNLFQIYNLKPKTRLLSLSKDDVSFKGGKSFRDFWVKAKRLGKPYIAIDKNNPLGEGRNAIVYAINGIDDYVMKINKTGEKPPAQFEINKMIPVNYDFDGRNFGQPIGEVSKDKGNYILIKQKGKEHSIENWMDYVFNRKELTRECVPKYYKDMDLLSQMPDESFVEFADSMKYRSDKGYPADFVNPQNILIDHENKSINAIDIFDWKDLFDLNNKNTYFDMVSPLLDFAMFEKYLKFLGPESQRKLIKNCQTIADKCKNAAQKVGLSMEESIFLDTVTKMDDVVQRVGPQLPDKNLKQRYETIKQYVNV